jgi:hypothetical protein
VAAAIAHDWNQRHASDAQLTALEIRAVRLGAFPAPDTRHEVLLSAWPSRDGSGAGSLDRWLRAHED